MVGLRKSVVFFVGSRRFLFSLMDKDKPLIRPLRGHLLPARGGAKEEETLTVLKTRDIFVCSRRFLFSLMDKDKPLR
jgi:hypothetical protein